MGVIRHAPDRLGFPQWVLCGARNFGRKHVARLLAQMFIRLLTLSATSVK